MATEEHFRRLTAAVFAQDLLLRALAQTHPDRPALAAAFDAQATAFDGALLNDARVPDENVNEHLSALQAWRTRLR